MIRGFASGILAGGVLSAVALAVTSHLAPPAAGPVLTPAVVAEPAGNAETTPPAKTEAAPTTPALDAPAGAVTPKAPAPTEQVAPAPDGAVTPPDATENPTVSPATPDKVKADDVSGEGATAPAPSGATTTPVPAQQATKVDDVPKAIVRAVDAAPAEPAAKDDTAKDDTANTTAANAPSQTAPVVTETVANDTAVALKAPDALTAVAPLAPVPSADRLPVAAAPAETRPVPALPDTLATLSPDLAPAAPAAPAAPPRIETGTAPAPAAPPVAETAPPVLAETVPAPVEPSGQDPLPGLLVEADPPVIDAPPASPQEPEPRILTEDAPLADENAATLDASPRLSGEVDGVVTGRLPRIGDTVDPTAVTGDPASPGDATPLVRFARAFENPDQKPVFSIILIDSGAADLDRKSLAELPFPVSFAIDPLDPAAADHAAIYRAAGQEVLMLATGIPKGATASDLEVSFAALSERLPEAVAVLEQVDPVFQDNRPLATQIVPILAAQGRGLVTWDAGLNAADQVARREGLPSVMAFRSLDSAQESVETVRRYLDRAAFRAAQEGRVVVIGQTRPETIQALIAWGLEGRSATIILAPITAALSVN